MAPAHRNIWLVPSRQGAVQVYRLAGRARRRVQQMIQEVELRYIPRSFALESRIRVTVFREGGSAILDVQNSVITEFCRPDSEGREDTLRAFRESIPAAHLERRHARGNSRRREGGKSGHGSRGLINLRHSVGETGS